MLEDRIPSFLSKFKCDYYLTNEASGAKIWLLWNLAVNVQLLTSSNQYLSVKVEENGNGFIPTAVYAKCNHLERKTLWEELEASGHGQIPWVLCGYFNIIKDDS